MAPQRSNFPAIPSRPASHEDARQSNKAATQMLRDVANGKFAAATKPADANDQRYAAKAKSGGVASNAFDRLSGLRQP